MFDQYSRARRRGGVNWALLVVVIAALVLGVGLLLHAKARHDTEEMNSLFALGAPPKLADGKPTLWQLPGMSLEAPGAFAITGDYDHGAARSDAWAVSWSPNTRLASPQDVPNQVKYIADRNRSVAGPIESIQLDRAPGFRVDFDGATHTTLIIAICGDRSVEIMAEADKASTTHAIDSFRCTPHPGRLVWRSAAVAPRTGWAVVPDKTTLELKSSRDVDILLVAAGASSTGMAVFDNAFELGPAIEHHGDYSIRRGIVHRNDDSTHPGALVTWPCPAIAATGYAYISQVGSDGLDDGIALAETGRCLRPDEP